MKRNHIESHRVLQELSKFSLKVDEKGVKERLESIPLRILSGETKLQGIKLAISMIDLTSLEGDETPEKIRALCRQAIHPMDNESDVLHTAAVCMYPKHIKYAKEIVYGSGVKVVSVTASFPSGQVPLDKKLNEVKEATELGADEVDMVLNWEEFLAGKIEYSYKEISEAKKICGNTKLKVILETGRLLNFENIKKASLTALLAGADFIKTSTGKIKPAATLPAALVMSQAIKEFHMDTGTMRGLKPAGGIRTTDDALAYLQLVRDTLGESWLTPELFRIGASALLNDLLIQYKKEISNISIS